MFDITFETYARNTFVLSCTARGDKAIREFQVSNKGSAAFPNEDLDKVCAYFREIGCSISV